MESNGKGSRPHWLLEKVS